VTDVVSGTDFHGLERVNGETGLEPPVVIGSFPASSFMKRRACRFLMVATPSQAWL
jgi:hypothetical protein